MRIYEPDWVCGRGVFRQQTHGFCYSILILSVGGGGRSITIAQTAAAAAAANAVLFLLLNGGGGRRNEKAPTRDARIAFLVETEFDKWQASILATTLVWML